MALVEVTPEHADAMVAIGVTVYVKRWETSPWDTWDYDDYDAPMPSRWFYKEPVGGFFAIEVE